nr:reverse transcriptase domain-containing protein [Tanacetum cinerariifolium]
MFLGKCFPCSMVTKLRNEITNFRQRPDELLFEAWEHYNLSIDRCPNHNMLPVTQIDTFYNGLTLRHRDTINAVAGGTFMKRRPKECYDLIENITAHHNDWDTPAQRILQINQQVKAVTPSCETCGGPYSYNDCSATISQSQNVYAVGAYQGGSGTLPSNIVTNLKEDLKGITTRSGTEYQGPTIPTTSSSSLSQVVERKTEIDVFEGELTLCVGKEAITFNLDQTSRYSANYNDTMANRIDVIHMACEDYSQEVLGFSDVIASGNPTPYYNPIISTSSLTLTTFRDSDFLLEEVDAFLALENDVTSSEVNHSYFNPEGDILFLKAFLNDDPSLPLSNQGTYLPQVRKELKICEAKNDKSLIDEPPEVELKDLPPHLKYTFLEGNDKLLVIIAKYLSVEEKAALIKVLKSHKQAIAWKLFDIKGAVLGKRHEKHFRPIHYASKTMTEAELHYTTTEKEMLAVGYAFEKFRSYLIMNKSIMYMDESALKYLFAKKYSKARLLSGFSSFKSLNSKERFCNEMKCFKIPSKFGIFSTFGASISWGRSRLHEGTNIYSWLSITVENYLLGSSKVITTLSNLKE